MLKLIALAAVIVVGFNANCAAAESYSITPAKSSQDGFVLFPGGNQDGSEWRLVVPNLKLPALTPDLPHGSSAKMTRSEYIAAILADIDHAGFDRVILVGHSGGGLILPALVMRIPDRVRHMIFVAANVPPEGGTALSVLAFDPLGFLIGLTMPESSIGWWEWRGTLCSDCDDRTFAQFRNHFDVTTNYLYGLETISRQGLPASIPRTYIKLLEDKSVLPARLQDQAAANIGAKIVTLHSGHMAPLTHPKELAAILNQIAAGDQKR